MKENRFRATRVILAILLLCLAGTAHAQVPSLVADIITGSNGSTPDNFAVFNGKLYFQADDGTNGRELWVYDGVKPPKMVANINPGSGWSSPSALTVFKNKLYFQADDGTHGTELWVYDGTKAPSIVADIYPGSSPGLFSITPEFVVYKNILYFQADNGSKGYELWKYDGLNTPSIAADIYPGSGGSFPYSFSIYNDSLYFSADDGSHGVELWLYNGTSAHLVKDINAGSGSSVPNYLTVMNGKLYFSADDGSNGDELWRYDDNSKSASLIADIYSGVGSAFPKFLNVYKNKLYFTADDAIHGEEPWSYSGSGSPAMVDDIYLGNFNGSFPTGYTVYNDTLYFAANDGTYGFELRKYSGSGTPALVADIYPGSVGSAITDPVIFKNSLYFAADDSTHGSELWAMKAPCTAKTSVDKRSACDSFKWINNITYYSSNNTAKDTLLSVSGCDSVVTLNLTIRKSATDTFVTACDNFSWHGTTYTSSTLATRKYTNAAGCDSIVTLHLRINKSSSSTINKTACESFNWYGTSYTSSTTVKHTLKNLTGCDSVITLVLTITRPLTTDTFATACDSFKWYGVTYTNSTLVTHAFPNPGGCDAVKTLHLTIAKPTYATVNYLNCSPVTVNGVTYSQRGTYTQKLKNSRGCDSILTVNYEQKSPVDTAAITECNRFVLNDKVYTQSGMYPFIIPGCDTVTLNLTIRKSDTTQLSATACDSFILNGQVFTNTGTYTQAFRNAAHCDSTVILHLTINKSKQVKDVQFACDSYKWIDDITYTESNHTATKRFKTAAGCDSIVLLDLTIGHPSTNHLSYANCSPVSVHGQQYASTGIYTQHLTNKSGCDSTLVIDYTYINKDTTISADVCNSYQLNGTTYTTSGTYLQTVPGCAGKITLNLKIRKSTSLTKNVTACNNYTWNGKVYTSSTIVKNTYTNAAGCDSTATLNLTIDNGYNITTSVSACSQYTWGGHNYTTAGKYTDSLKDKNGCDSVLTLDLSLPETSQVSTDPSISNSTYFTRISLSRDGKTLAIMETNENFTLLRMLTWNGTTWQKKATITLPGQKKNQDVNLSFSKDASTVAVSFKADLFHNEFGATYVYSFDGTNLSAKGATFDGNAVKKMLGGAISLSADGNVISIGNYNNFAGGHDSIPNVKVYYYDAGAWKPKGFPIQSLLMFLDQIGTSVSLSDDGNTIAIGSLIHTEDIFFSTELINTGVRVYQWNGTFWIQKGNAIKISTNIVDGDYIRKSYFVKLSSDGSILAVSVEEGFRISGQIAVYKWNNGWTQRGSTLPDDVYGMRRLGRYCELSDDGNIMLTIESGLYYSYNNNRSLDRYEWNGSDYILKPLSAYNLIYGPVAVSGDGNRMAALGWKSLSNNVLTFDKCPKIINNIEEKPLDNANNIQFSIYPNPSTGIFNIRSLLPPNMSSQSISYEIYNVEGKAIGFGKLEKLEGSFTLSDQPAGMYLLRLKVGNTPAGSKILLKQ